jgi:hypothetical protein
VPHLLHLTVTFLFFRGLGSELIKDVNANEVDVIVLTHLSAVDAVWGRSSGTLGNRSSFVEDILVREQTVQQGRRVAIVSETTLLRDKCCLVCSVAFEVATYLEW